ncbi:MAG: hypothetical protein Q4G35_11345 [Propionibacteriaceae bacterium]|nr:hypothetical protein [Propionibacteriaceae bacterium]
MTQGLPDDLFRPGADQRPPKAREERKLPRVPKPSSVKTLPLESRGISPRVLAGLIVLALLVAFAIGRLFFFTPQGPVVTVSPAPSVTEAPPVTATPGEFVAYTGPVMTIPALTAEGTCEEEDTSEGSSALIDADPATIWRCAGSAVGEQLRFTFSGRRPLVGLRVVNGNSAWADRYLAERRIMSLRWEFDDGSFFVQGLAANNRNLQEVRFPPLTATAVTLTVLEVTVPGDDSANSDAVSISAVEFLSPA